MTHGPVQEAYRERLNALAKVVDDFLNPGHDKGRRKTVGFAVLMFPFGEDLKGDHRINYIGNGKREDILVALKELVARWEGRHPEEMGMRVPKQ